MTLVVGVVVEAFASGIGAGATGGGVDVLIRSLIKPPGTPGPVAPYTPPPPPGGASSGSSTIIAAFAGTKDGACTTSLKNCLVGTRVPLGRTTGRPGGGGGGGGPGAAIIVTQAARGRICGHNIGARNMNAT